MKKLLLILLCLPLIGFGQDPPGLIDENEDVLIKRKKERIGEIEFLIPPVFSPNEDGINDYWKVTGRNSDKITQIQIYNRHGGLIFTTNDPLKGWDGTFNGSAAQDGNYIYHLQYINGVGALIEKTDVITLIR